jgi:hypothetical protein
LFVWLVGWFDLYGWFDWLAGWLVGLICLFDWLVGWLV